jgi:glycosyltransferase involved in cell wall biosynthesis
MLEAMAMGLPIVASDVQGIGEALTDMQDGLLIPAGSWRPLGDALLRLSHHPELGHRLGAAAQARFTAFYTSDRMIQETLALYEKLRSR